MSVPEWTTIKTELLQKIISKTNLTGEEVRVIIAYYVTGGHFESMVGLLQEGNPEYLQTKIDHLKSRGYFT